MPLISLAKSLHVGHWFVIGLAVGLARMIWVGISKKRKANGDSDVTADGGSFNAYRGL